MGKIPQRLRETIAGNIRDCRLKKFPGRGGGMKCAEAFSRYIGQKVSPQQWSPWERGVRTPDEIRLEQIAAFFGVTVEYMRHDKRPLVPGAPSTASPPQTAAGEPAPEPPRYDCNSALELIRALFRDNMKAVCQVEISVSSVSFVPCDEAASR